MEREQRQSKEHEQEASVPREREPEREANIWDALDDIGREPPSPHDQTTATDAMQRVQERTTEQKHEREREAAKIERAKVEREKMQQEKNIEIGLRYGF